MIVRPQSSPPLSPPQSKSTSPAPTTLNLVILAPQRMGEYPSGVQPCVSPPSLLITAGYSLPTPTRVTRPLRSHLPAYRGARYRAGAVLLTSLHGSSLVASLSTHQFLLAVFPTSKPCPRRSCMLSSQDDCQGRCFIFIALYPAKSRLIKYTNMS